MRGRKERRCDSIDVFGSGSGSGIAMLLLAVAVVGGGRIGCTRMRRVRMAVCAFRASSVVCWAGVAGVDCARR